MLCDGGDMRLLIDLVTLLPTRINSTGISDRTLRALYDHCPRLERLTFYDAPEAVSNKEKKRLEKKGVRCLPPASYVKY